jgi:putative ABC transport system permease protein
MKSKENPPSAPPRWIRRLLTFFHPENTVEEVSGDLDELYDHWHEKHGKTAADLKYALNVLSVLPPFVRRRKQAKEYPPGCRTTPNFQPAMIRNYFKIAWRNIAHNKSFSSINVLGLALGMACSLLIMLWIQDEFSVDRYHANGPQLYHVMERQFFDGKVEAGTGTPGLLADELKKEFPEIAYSSGLSWQ